MYPVPSSERSMPEHRHKAAARQLPTDDFMTQRRITEGMQRRLHEISTFEHNRSHYLWSHLSAPGKEFTDLEKRHVTQHITSFQPSKKRTKEHCHPFPEEQNRRLFPSEGGLAEPRPAVLQTALHDYGSTPHCVPQGDHVARHRRILEPIVGSTKNILCLGAEPAQPSHTGRKFLTLPRSPSAAPQVPLGFQSNKFGMFCDMARPTGMKRITGQPQYDPLSIRSQSSFN
jgi:hypothetical protein